MVISSGGGSTNLRQRRFSGLTACRDLAPVSFATGGDGDFVVGPGGWCWFQAPRATFNRGRLYLATSVSSTGTKRNGDLEVTEVDVTTRRTVRHTVGHTRPDDHAAPSVLAVDGEIQVAWSTHNRNSWIEVGRLGTRLHRIGRPDSLVAPGRGVSYASAHVVDGRRWLLYRGEQFSWNLLVSAGGWRHAYRWARQTRGGGWTVEHLAWAGSELYWGQPDYSGLASVDPTNPNRVVVSTNVHPATGELLVSRGGGLTHWELWEDVRVGAASWSWTAVTSDSTVDNIRPVVAADLNRKALAWMRGTYRDWTHFATDIVVRPV